MTLLDKLTAKSLVKFPAEKRDCPTRKRRKQNLRDQWIAHWLLKYRKRYERMYGGEPSELAKAAAMVSQRTLATVLSKYKDDY